MILIAGLPGSPLLQSYKRSQGQARTFSQNPAALRGLDPANVLASALIQKRNVIRTGFAALGSFSSAVFSQWSITCYWHFDLSSQAPFPCSDRDHPEKREGGVKQPQ
ncbi:MAG: hypothetical protein WCK35_22275 [Chloroflexota bacterium]